MDLAQLAQNAPPVSRTIAGATLILSVCAYALNVVHPAALIYYPPFVWGAEKFQPWRLVTSFLLSGPKLSILMDPFFLFRYASQCETSKFTRPGDMVTFLVFCGAVIVLLNTFILDGMVFCNPLMLALAYYWTAFEPAASRVNFFIATFPVKFLPYIMLLMTFVQAGLKPTLVHATGLIAGHAYLFLTEIWPQHGGGPSLIWTPAWVHSLLERTAAPAQAPQAAPRRAAAPGASAGAGSGVPVGGRTGATGSLFGGVADSWTHRGQGHRLGS